MSVMSTYSMNQELIKFYNKSNIEMASKSLYENSQERENYSKSTIIQYRATTTSKQLDISAKTLADSFKIKSHVFWVKIAKYSSSLNHKINLLKLKIRTDLIKSKEKMVSLIKCTYLKLIINR